jgi:two-component system alkaline phosphatase synthesis response regulator PhoP
MAYTGQKILLIDDDPAFRELYSAVFQVNGINFSLASNGMEGMEKAKAEKPALVLLDIMLPDMNGFDVLKSLKQNQETSSIPVWMISNLAEQTNRETAASLGATDYLFKANHTPKLVSDKIKAFFDGQVPSSTTPPPQ